MPVALDGIAGISDCVTAIDAHRVRPHVETLCALGPRSIEDPDAIHAATAYLRSTLTSYGYAVREEPFGEAPGDLNLLAELPGTTRPDRVVELGAHYDTVPGSPGADDNASAVAGLLEIARVLAAVRTQKTLRFCLFGGEESGLRGSRAHVRALERATQEHVEGITVFEMIGYRSTEPHSQRSPVRIPFVIWPPRTGDFIVAISNYSSRSIVRRFQKAARQYVPELPVYAVKRLGGLIQDASRSDHLPYWRAGRPGMMLTDTANFRNPNYHQPTDTPETLDYDFLAQVTRATLGMLLDWVGILPRPTVNAS